MKINNSAFKGAKALIKIIIKSLSDAVMLASLLFKQKGMSAP